MRTIYIISPTITKEFDERTLRESEAAASPETQLHVVSIDKGPASIECYYDGVLTAPYVVHKVGEVAEKKRTGGD